MLLRADLELATENAAEARKWYQRLLDLWGKADPELQPVVAAVRKKLGKQ